MQWERVMSMMRYWPAKGTAGLARSRVRGKSLSPAPPASRTPSVSLMVRLPRNDSLETTFPSDAKNCVRVSRGETRVYHAGMEIVLTGIEGQEEAGSVR